MADPLNISISGLLAFQRALSTTSHNIANATTEGFSRQRVELGTRIPESLGGFSQGTGVQVNDVRRVFDGFLATEVRTATTEQARLDVFAGLAGRVGDLLGSRAGGLSTGLQTLFEGVQKLANDPSSLPVRQTLLGEADTIARRFAELDRQLETLGRETFNRVESSVDAINGLARALADINERIVRSPGAANGQFPSDLLDRRETLLRELAAQVDVRTVAADDGSVNVFISNGQSLVLGQRANEMSVSSGDFGADELEIRIGGVAVTSQLGGGELGGLLDFKREVLDPVRNDLGRSAVVLADSFNTQHRQGLDLNGQFGGDFFDVGAPRVLAARSNSGSGELSVAVADIGALTGNDYTLNFDGTNFSLIDSSTGSAVALGGSGTPADPFTADGLSIVIDDVSNFSAGDRFRIQPTRIAASGLSVAISDPAKIAASAPMRTASSLDNIGDATISAGQVVDFGDPNLLTTSTITFDDPPVSYTINGGPSVPFVSGDTVTVNGFEFQLEGSPTAGDSFTIEPNFGGVGDNRNALALGDLRDARLIAGGTRSIVEQADILISRIGATTGAAQAALESQTVLLNSAQDQLMSVSGVNLDEEAANLLRFQQAFEANARVISIVNTTFQALLAATR
ncbi:MAG: flagellar hook-associated protein FlgK [Wenzhouxiangellaceae bacterium]|nr:flagellar hook-associated protein FlgK [Wenzhouxiangellaceae bacterium]